MFAADQAGVDSEKPEGSAQEGSADRSGASSNSDLLMLFFEYSNKSMNLDTDNIKANAPSKFLTHRPGQGFVGINQIEILKLRNS